MTDICSISVKSRRKGKALKVRTALKAGGIDPNHSRRLMAVGRPRKPRLSPESLAIIRRYFAMLRRLPQKERA